MTNLAFMFVLATQSFNLPQGLLSALCYTESNHRTHVVNIHDGGSSSHGVCQIKEGTAKLMGFKGTKKDLMRPQTNIYYSAKYLNYQIKRYKGDLRKAIAAYNSGTYMESDTGETYNKAYVSKVFKAWAENR